MASAEFERVAAAVEAAGSDGILAADAGCRTLIALSWLGREAPAE